MIGEKFAHYSIVAKLGEGGMGSVWLAEDTLLDRKVALKFLSASQESDETARRRFLREARAAAALDHPFVCKIYEAGEESGRAYIAMEYAEGQPLDRRLGESGPLAVPEVVKIASEIAEAMEAAHRRQIVHRDLKPSNVMITADGHLKILDFGLAKQLPMGLDKDDREKETALTGSGVVQGTMGYMSPEQLRGQEVDTRSDIFSFGVLIYEMLAGVTPFKRETTADSITAIVNEQPPPISRFRSDVPGVLEHTVRKMLAKSVDDRFQTAHEVRTDLRQLVADETRYFEAAEAAVPRPRANRVLRSVAVVLGIAAVVFLAWFAGTGLNLEALFGSGAGPKSHRLPRLAVLPFTNPNGIQDEPFSDGLTSTIITRLTRLRGLKVISAPSVMRFKNRKGMNLSEIAEQLKADYIVDGSLQSFNERYRVNVNLINGADESNVWAGGFTYPWTDIFALQDRISEGVLAGIDSSLRDEIQALTGVHETPPGAYRALLHGQYSAASYKKKSILADFEEARAFFDEALAEYPEYIDAQVEMGLLFWERSYKDNDKSWLDESQKILERVLEREPSQVQAISRLGWIRGKAGDADGWYDLANQAIAISPNFGLAHNSLASFFWYMGYYESALIEYGRGIELDPLSLDLLRNRALTLAALERYDEAIVALEEGLAIDPEHWLTNFSLVETQIQRGRLDEAQRVLDRLRNLKNPAEEPAIQILDSTIAALRGDPAPGRDTLASNRKPKDSYVLPLLRLAGSVGDAKSAIRLIRQTNPSRKPIYRELLDPMIRPLHKDPEFQQALEKSFADWEKNLIRYGPTLPLPPGVIPLPQDFIESSDG